MGGELRTIAVGMAIRDWSKLPDDYTTDDVYNEVADVIERACREWYAERGRLLLSSEPVVA